MIISKKASIIGVVILILGIVSWGLYSYFVSRNNSVQDDSMTSTDLPSDRKTTIFTEDEKFLWNKIIGVVEGYGTSELPQKLNYMTLKFIAPGAKETKTVNVLLQIPEYKVSKIFDKYKAKEGYDIVYNEFQRTYVTKIKYQRLEAKTDEYQYVSFDDFKSDNPKGTLLSIYVLSQYPDTVDRTEKYCVKGGLSYCEQAFLTDYITVDVSKFWKDLTLDSNRYLVPKLIKAESNQ